MKKTYLLILSICLLALITACKVTENTPDATDAPEATATPVPTATPEPETVNIPVENFEEMTNPMTAMNPMDLGRWGIENPALSIVSEETDQGKGMKVALNPNRWCQAFQIDDAARIAIFNDNVKEEYYLRLYIHNPSGIPIGVTINLTNGSKQSFPDSTEAILTSVDGTVIQTTTGNATDDAGPGSSVTVPDHFTGWIAWKLDKIKPWSVQQGIESLNVTYIRIDLRPKGAIEGDYYVIDSFCFTDKPYGALREDPNNPGSKDYEAIRADLAARFTQLKNAAPQFEYCPEYDPAGYPNIKAIWFIGEEQGGKKTKVFAYIGFPSNASKDKPVPGVVLQHGGGGYAYPSWIKEWTDRGYAAIAVCNTGFYPARQGITDFFGAGSWTHTLNDSTYTLAPNNDDMKTSKSSLDRQWMYHAVSQTIIANNILRQSELVDSNKIGLTGISWGGVIASIAIGYDNRFAFAIPVYGSGYLYESLAWMKDNFNYPGTKEIWDASWNLKSVTMPVLWLCWTDDNCFSINSNSKSFDDTAKGILSMKMNMQHGHIEGWVQPEIYRFADSVVKGAQPLTTLKTQPSGKNISFKINAPKDATKVTAKVYYIKEQMTYSRNGRLHYDWCDTIDQTWYSVNCTVKGDTITAKLPNDAHSYYVEITTQVGSTNYVTTSRFVTPNK